MAFVIVSLGILALRMQAGPNWIGRFACRRSGWWRRSRRWSRSALMAGLPMETWRRLVIWMVIGVVLYFAYGYRHSNLSNPQRA